MKCQVLLDINFQQPLFCLGPEISFNSIYDISCFSADNLVNSCQIQNLVVRFRLSCDNIDTGGGNAGFYHSIMFSICLSSGENFPHNVF